MMQRIRGKQQNGKEQRSPQKVGDVKGTFHARTGMIKDRNGKGQKEAKEIKRWQKYTEEPYRKGLNDRDNHNGMITHLEPDILECEVKWSLGRTATKNYR